MMRFTSAPIVTRMLLGLAAVSVGLLGWTLLGPRAVPAAAGAPASTTFPVYPAGVAQASNAINDADPAWARPLFFRDRKPHTADLGGPGDANGATASSFDGTLTGIVRSSTLSAASLQKAGQQQSVRVRLGQEVPDAPGWRLVELTAKTARFQSGSDEKILKLEVPRPDGMPPPQTPAADPPAAAPPMTGSPPPAAKNPAQPAPGANAPPAPITAQGTPTQLQQIEAVRQRIEAARKAQQQPSSSAKH
jgi:hypothetical protein